VGIVENLCKFFCNIVGLQLQGQSVLLRVDDTPDSSLFGIVVKGTIYDLKLDNTISVSLNSELFNSPFAIIKLDTPLIYNGENIDWLLAVSRHKRYGFYRLCLTWIAVYIFALEEPIFTRQPSWDQIIAICSMKIIK
jgi:hypothetical protein